MGRKKGGKSHLLCLFRFALKGDFFRPATSGKGRGEKENFPIILMEWERENTLRKREGGLSLHMLGLRSGGGGRPLFLCPSLPKEEGV